MIAAAITFPLVFGWMSFESVPGSIGIYRVILFGFPTVTMPYADKNLRLGRFEYIDGQDTQPKNAVIAWLHARITLHPQEGFFPREPLAR